MRGVQTKSTGGGAVCKELIIVDEVVPKQVRGETAHTFPFSLKRQDPRNSRIAEVRVREQVLKVSMYHSELKKW